jgi:6-phosphogluconolactonase
MDQNLSALEIYQDADGLADAAAQFFSRVAARSISSRGMFSVALAGGTTPRATYELLANTNLARDIDWSNVHLFWGDERCVPPDHPDSNYNMVRQALLEKVLVPNENVHRIRGELDPMEAAALYRAEIKSVLGPEPSFDLILLGMGADGHTASLFPATSALEEDSLNVVAVYVDKLQSWRVTLTLPALNRARHLLFLVSGSTKAPALTRIQAGEPLPPALVQPTDGEMIWMVDLDAASSVRQSEALQ